MCLQNARVQLKWLTTCQDRYTIPIKWKAINKHNNNVWKRWLYHKCIALCYWHEIALKFKTGGFWLDEHKFINCQDKMANITCKRTTDTSINWSRYLVPLDQVAKLYNHKFRSFFVEMSVMPFRSSGQPTYRAHAPETGRNQSTDGAGR